MAVPIALNLPLDKAVNVQSDSQAGPSSDGSNKQFTEHFDRHVQQLNDKGSSAKGAGKHTNESFESKGSKRPEGEDATSKTLANTQASGDKKTKIDAVSDDASSANELHDEIDDVSTGIVDKTVFIDDLNVSIEGGNSLPITADSVPLVDMAAQAIDKPILNVNLDTGVASGVSDIVFDPLAQATDSSGQIASMMVSNQLSVDKFKLNGKTGVADFLTPLNTTLSLDNATHVDSLVLKADNLFKTNALSQLDGEFGLIKSSSGLDLPINNVAGAASQLNNMSPVLTDKPTLSLDMPVNSSRWSQEFGQRIQWMVNQSVSAAQIRITPQHMGPIEVRVQMQNDQATIAFTAQHGATREAIDAALPRLRDMLSEQNVNVLDVNISQHSFAEQRDQQTKSQNTPGRESSDIAFNGEESIFDSQDSSQQRHYSGLFSDFA